MDEDAILQLNQLAETETSPLDLNSLRSLSRKAFHIGLRDQGRSAFLIALSEEADYDNDNFRWFKNHYPAFVYVDRVIVSKTKRGQGLARSLYEELFQVSLASLRHLVVCEVNIDPPNPASDAFHAALQFETIGEAQLRSGKRVRYLSRNYSIA